jgi:mycofactocin system glycosyltransferase
VVVVDDASTEPVSVAAVAARHGAMLLRLGVNAGPAAARNAGLRSVTTNLVVFLDSDCVPSSGWIRSLAAHLVDPLVGAVAPRIRPVPAASGPHAYAQTNGALDLGPHPALVGPRSAVAYVPTAALLVRRSAAQDFDESMRFGEDVDLVWRLREAGWRVRYEPSVEVAHQEPNSWRSLLLRRFHYGTSAGPLARRHPGAMAPVALPPWALIAVAGTVLRQPSLVGLGVGGTLVATTRGLRRAGLPGGGHRLAAETLCRTWAGAGRYLTQLAGPVIVAAALPRQARPGRRLVLAALVLAGPLAEWVNRRPALGPARYVAARIADDVAYGAGVWTGAVQARTSAPVRPTFIRLRTRQSEDQS